MVVFGSYFLWGGRVWEDTHNGDILDLIFFMTIITQKQSPIGILRKRCSGICSKSIGEDQCWSVVSIKLLYNFIKIALRHGCSPVNLLHIFRTTLPENTCEQLRLLTWMNVFGLTCCFLIPKFVFKFPSFQVSWTPCYGWNIPRKICFSKIIKQSCCYIWILAVMVASERSFLVVTNTVATVNCHWTAIILNTEI